jgi:hypothetical protein
MNDTGIEKEKFFMDYVHFIAREIEIFKLCDWAC